jgi:hypothetical protein
MGDVYASAIGDSFKHLQPKVIRLSENRLSPKGACSLLMNINSNLQELNLSNNKMNSYVMDQLGKSLSQSKM